MCQTSVIHLLDNLKKTNKKTVKQKKAEKQTKEYIISVANLQSLFI